MELKSVHEKFKDNKVDLTTCLGSNHYANSCESMDKCGGT